jgi:DNA-binding MarR family transcriptional regulator
MRGSVDRGPPYVGALLRLSMMVVRRRLLNAIARGGYVDVTSSHLPLFAYPFPEGMQPSDLAARASQSKQAMNHVLVEMEKRGYIARKATPPKGRRLVYLTRKGKDVVDICQKEMLGVQREWAKKVGRRQFDNFLDVLRRVATEA